MLWVLKTNVQQQNIMKMNKEQKPEAERQATILATAVLAAVPVRIQRSRQHRQVSPNGLPIVYVGRPGRWGNPFKVGSYYEHLYGLIETKEQAMIAFKNTIGFESNGLQKDLEAFNAGIIPMAFYDWNKIKSELSGKNLACWCPLNCQCHADILLLIANCRYGS